jgi:hypothetical protein
MPPEKRLRVMVVDDQTAVCEKKVGVGDKLNHPWLL